MSNTEKPDIEDQLSDLVEDRRFGDLTAQFGRFNLFEAAGTVRRELDHSNFLAYLLSPNRPQTLDGLPSTRHNPSFIQSAIFLSIIGISRSRTAARTCLTVVSQIHPQRHGEQTLLLSTMKRVLKFLFFQKGFGRGH